MFQMYVRFAWKVKFLESVLVHSADRSFREAGSTPCSSGAGRYQLFLWDHTEPYTDPNYIEIKFYMLGLTISTSNDC